MISRIEFDEIYPIWRKDLWPERVSEITTTSAMCFLGGYDLVNLTTCPIFIGYKEDNQILGVNSLHPCGDKSYRSRGLFVYPKFRGKGIGIKLLLETIDIAKNNNATFIWSYPKNVSWNTYKNAGFVLSSDWHNSELGINAYCKLELKGNTHEK